MYNVSINHNSGELRLYSETFTHTVWGDTIRGWIENALSRPRADRWVDLRRSLVRSIDLRRSLGSRQQSGNDAPLGAPSGAPWSLCKRLLHTSKRPSKITLGDHAGGSPTLPDAGNTRDPKQVAPPPVFVSFFRFLPTPLRACVRTLCTSWAQHGTGRPRLWGERPRLQQARRKSASSCARVVSPGALRS